MTKKNPSKTKVSANELKKKAFAEKSNELHTQFSESIHNISENVEALPYEGQGQINY